MNTPFFPFGADRPPVSQPSNPVTKPDSPDELSDSTPVKSFKSETASPKSGHATGETLLGLINDSAVIFDPHSDLILSANDKTWLSYQILDADLVDKPYKSVWVNVEEERNFVETVLRAGAVKGFKTSHWRADKTLIDVSINAALIEYKQKPAIIAINHNVSERLEIEQGILRAKQEWSDTVDAVSDLIILEDEEGKLRRCNKATADFFGQSFLDLIGKPVEAVLWKTDDLARFLMPKKIAGGSAEHLRAASWEGQLAGGERWYEITNHALDHDSEGTRSWVHIVKDITARKSSEAELQRLYTAIEQAADSILITDLNGVIQYVNASFEKTSGWTRTESVGRKVSDVKAGLEENDNTDEIFSALLNGEVWQKTYKAVRRSGEIFDEQATISLVRDAESNPLNYVFVCRDVTETRRLQSIAEAVNMMDNVGYIFSGIRHELGNPINSVKTALTVLKQNLGKWQDEQIEIYIERCLTETARVEYLLRTLKTFSMHENPQMQRVPLMDYMKKFVSLIGEDFEQRNIKITVFGGGEIGDALCDPRALHQVMLNLLTNSADSFEEDGAAEITISLARDKKRIYVNVTDNGAGMSESQMSNLFKPFYTSKPDGNGLGLVIVRSMLGKMNGTISIQSAQNMGTSVIFTLEAANSEV
ncbi:MAG TPA: PAS domain S-box protein [Pyrinomonadaceae bacterium]|jgi:PAS domain S-box-containing protein